MKMGLSRVTLVAGVLGLATATVATSPASAQYFCPDGYYYIEGYGCAPLDYYSSPVIVPGFGFFYGRGWHGGGWHGGGWHGSGGGSRGGGRHH